MLKLKGACRALPGVNFSTAGPDVTYEFTPGTGWTAQSMPGFWALDRGTKQGTFCAADAGDVTINCINFDLSVF